jgi:hypothetical protein
MAFDKQLLLIGIVGSVLTTLALAWMSGWGWTATLAIGVFFVVFDIIRTRNAKRNVNRLRNWYLLRHRQPPDESILAFIAHSQSAIMLWFVEIVSLGSVALAIFFLVKTPEHWLMAVPALAFSDFAPLSTRVCSCCVTPRRRHPVQIQSHKKSG